jgi:peptide/nickel transport system permease protein
MSAAQPTTQPKDSADSAQARARSRGYWAEVWHRFRRKPLPMIALGFVLLLAIIALFSPAIAGTKPVVCYYKGRIYFPALGYFRDRWENPIFTTDKFRNQYYTNLPKKDPNSWAIWPLVFQDPNQRLRKGWHDVYPENPIGDKGAPNRFNLMGTTTEGVDVFSHLIHGTRLALLVGFVTMGIAAAIGISLGALAGYFGGIADMLLSRLIEIVMCIPTLILILALIAIMERPSVWHTMVIIGVTGWTGIARLTRAEFLKLKVLDYVTAARAMGAGHLRIIFRHILPNALAPVLVPITFGIAAAILIENALRFLGLGDLSGASWGLVLNEGRENLKMWWLIVFPGTAIFLTVMAYNLIGEGLQEATDPRLREGTK